MERVCFSKDWTDMIHSNIHSVPYFRHRYTVQNIYEVSDIMINVQLFSVVIRGHCVLCDRKNCVFLKRTIGSTGNMRVNIACLTRAGSSVNFVVVIFCCCEMKTNLIWKCVLHPKHTAYRTRCPHLLITCIHKAPSVFTKIHQINCNVVDLSS